MSALADLSDFLLLEGHAVGAVIWLIVAVALIVWLCWGRP